ncbi:MAG: polyphosphate kinase 1 [Verrucomicrobia bacterium]|nr:polyphosphate kinase 1 [Verrucomicrobiota bacterium]
MGSGHESLLKTAGLIPDGKGDRNGEETAPVTPESSEAYINRELSWLHFAQRVMALAEDRTVPLLERVKFAGIMGMLYDEFAMKRIGGLRRRIEHKKSRPSPDGRVPRQELQLCREELKRQTRMLCRLVEKEIRPALAKAGIPLKNYDQLNTDEGAWLETYFRNSVQPILTPLAADVGHPFPFISNLGLSLAVWLYRPGESQPRFIRIKVPPNRPRWVPLPLGGFVPLEQVIAQHLNLMFPSGVRWDSYCFRVTRGAKDDPWDRLPLGETELNLAPGSIIGMVSAELTARKFAGIVRVEISSDMPEKLQSWLAENLAVSSDDIIPMESPLALTDLIKFQPEDCEHLRDPEHHPVDHPRLHQLEAQDAAAIFEEIRRGDILLHHPYHDFDTSVLRFIESAARDPQVLAIKLTIYRTGERSPVILALTEAARRGKQVVVLVEITARFDEAPNIAWGEQLEKAGAHVEYGMERLKTHVKLGLVVREETDGLRQYVHISTGNYHNVTARLYEDLGIFSCDPTLAASVAAVFNELTGAIPFEDYGPLLVAPHNMRERFTELIRREVDHQRAGRASGIRIKLNQLEDPKIIRELYEASRAGVPITLCVRGLCCLRAGVPGLSPTIRVFSIVGRFLEHSRIYRFENGGHPEFYLGSADWMRRNFESRMETVAPVTDPVIRSELGQILDVYDSDNTSAWDMQPDGHYLRRRPASGEAPREAQQLFMQLAAQALSSNDEEPRHDRD